MKLNENNWIYIGCRLGMLAMTGAVAWFLLAMFVFGSVMSIWPWAISIFVVGFVVWRISKSRWDMKYKVGLSVPCLICSREFTKEQAPFGPGFRDRAAEITCPHCGKSVEY